MLKKLMLLLGSMAAVALVGAIIIIIANQKPTEVVTTENKPFKVVTSFYPVYLIGINIANGAEGIEVKSLTDMNTGCLHDYQLTTEDMKSITDADVLIINGGGMESFLDDIKANYPNLTIIDASQGIQMLPYDTSNTGAALNLDILKNNKEQILSKYNAHVWLNPTLYIKQIENVRDGIISYINSLDNQNNTYTTTLTQKLETNAQDYINSVQQIEDLYEKEGQAIAGKSTSQEGQTITGNSTSQEGQTIAEKSMSQKGAQAVIFHDSFAYIADKLGIKVAFTVPLDSDTALSAGDIAVIIDEVKKEQIKYLFTEQQFSDSIAKRIEAETAAKVYVIDSVVTGDGSKDSYINAMKKNLKVISDALQ
ncbi:MAG TPA: metal ABC transporter substrate-binding protein [Mobilitalea sp.]|nr:metal ABC transporter substrate-binding protein [Mobilitalea sp.]